MSKEKSQAGSSFSSIMRLAICFGVIGGLAEAAVRYTLPLTGWVSSPQKACVDEAGISWAAIIAQVAVLVGVGSLLWLLQRVRPHWVPRNVIRGVFAFVCFWSALTAVTLLEPRSILVLALGLGAAIYRLPSWRKPRNPAAVLTPKQSYCVGAMGIFLLTLIAPWAIERWGQHATGRAAPDSPNVLLIILDTLRADRLGAYGYARGTSPFLDDYAKHSVLYERAFSSSSWTLPAHISLFTGHRPLEHGAVLDTFDDRYETLAQTLAKHGYQTAGFAANTSYVLCRNGVAVGFDHFEGSYISLHEALLRTSLGQEAEKLLQWWTHRKLPYPSAQKVNQRFLKWLDGRPPQPFFAYLNFMDTHYPYRTSKDFLQRFPGAQQPPNLPEWGALVGSPQPPDAALNRRVQDTYDASVAYLDAQLKALFEQIHARGMDQNLLVIIASDHGDALGEHHLFDHRHSLYRELVQIPLIVHFPGRLPEGVRMPGTVSLRYIGGTILDFLGIPSADFPPGRLKFRPEDDPDGTSRAVLSHVAGGKFPGVYEHWPIYQGWVRSVVKGDLQFVLQENGKMELFNWKEDPQETHDLIEKADPQLIREFRAHLAGVSPTPAEPAHTSTSRR